MQLKITRWSAHSICEEKWWFTTNVHGLSTSEQDDKEESLSIVFNLWSSRTTWKCEHFLTYICYEPQSFFVFYFVVLGPFIYYLCCMFSDPHLTTYHSIYRCSIKEKNWTTLGYIIVISTYCKKINILLECNFFQTKFSIYMNSC